MSEQSVLDAKIYSLAKELDDSAPFMYRIKQGGTGRFHIYRTQAFKYKTRTTEKVKTCKTKALAHKYMSAVEKRIANDKEKIRAGNPA